MENKKTALGISENIEGLLCYILGLITGIVFLLLEKENKFVRFHAMQSLTIFLALFVISLVGGAIPILGWIVSILTFPVGLIIALFLMYKAYQGETYKFPIAGGFAEKQIGLNENQNE
ncbi:MAG: DUF4870 domain-containing protein [Clostridiales bacterium]|nr:DUF4870 domain-containing protein [Clostridiales bacterium]MCF8022991.1 DUF4870 domain-containing protein [Clostridiales bacterium]